MDGPCEQVAATFGERVAEQRRAMRDPASGRPMSQERLAEQSGFHRTYISQVERGVVNIALCNIVRLADALETDPSVLLAGLRHDG